MTALPLYFAFKSWESKDKKSQYTNWLDNQILHRQDQFLAQVEAERIQRQREEEREEERRKEREEERRKEREEERKQRAEEREQREEREEEFLQLVERRISEIIG